MRWKKERRGRMFVGYDEEQYGRRVSSLYQLTLDTNHPVQLATVLSEP
jgi:hypothetical protein